MVALASPGGHLPRPASSPAIVVRFQRGGQITCANPAQARTIVARHLERAHLNGVEDRVVFAPEDLLTGQS